jgi:hypothetical protein
LQNLLILRWVLSSSGRVGVSDIRPRPRVQSYIVVEGNP